jgi:hypothetical protein
MAIENRTHRLYAGVAALAVRAVITAVAKALAAVAALALRQQTPARPAE